MTFIQKRLHMLVLLITFLFLSVAVTTPISTHAQIQPLQDVTFVCQVPLEQTNWIRPCVVDKFDPALGTLQSVTIATESHIEYEVVMEYTDTTAGNIDFSITNNSVRTWDTTQTTTFISTIFPDDVETIAFSSWDGVTDFNGPSGNSYDGATTDSNENIVYPMFSNTSTDQVTLTGSDMNQFVGTDTYEFQIQTNGLAGITSTSNFLGGVTTRGSADLTTTFSYEPFDDPTPVFEPDLVRTGGQITLPVAATLLMLIGSLILFFEPNTQSSSKLD